MPWAGLDGWGGGRIQCQPSSLVTHQHGMCGGKACGTTVSLAITESAVLYAWGLGTNGVQLGQRNEEDLAVPTRIMTQQLENRRGDPSLCRRVGSTLSSLPRKKNRHQRFHVGDWYAYIHVGRDIFERRENIEMYKAYFFLLSLQQKGWYSSTSTYYASEASYET
jgi:hypothetical protein